MEEGLSLLVDFAIVIAIWSALSPLVISLLKNIGGDWPTLAKQATSFGFAVVGAIVAYATTAGLGGVNLLDPAVYQPLIVGVAGAFTAQYAIYNAMWEGTDLEATLASFGNSAAAN